MKTIAKTINLKSADASKMTTIAIIQDDIKFVSNLPDILETYGDFHVASVYYFIEDAQKGLQENPVDIVILDMKSEESIDWIKEIKNKVPFAKWLVYTLHGDDEIIFNTLRAGANGYIIKDGQPEHLKNALHELMSGGAPMSPCIINKLMAYFHHLPKKQINHNTLSVREKEILHFTSRGLLYKEIAMQLGIQRETVKKHLSKIYEKLHVQNKIEAVNKFYGL